MIQDMSPRDVQQLIEYFIHHLYKKSLDYFKEEFFNIAVRNREARQSMYLTFRFGGKTYKYENADIRFPQTLVQELYPEMHDLVNRRHRIIEEEGAYARSAIVAACSRCESVTHLYQLLPECLWPFLREIGIREELDPYFTPLPEKEVMAFKQKHEINLDKIAQRITRNMLGIIK